MSTLYSMLNSSSQQTTSTASVDENEGVMTSADSSEEVFELILREDGDPKYLYYPQYFDDDYSTVDNLKNITLSQNQINITAETNSQVIPFKLNRYYDGIDLSEMTFSINYVNANKQWSLSSPINVMRSNSQIKFYWLVDSSVTAITGLVDFEIMASGTVAEKNYIWRTKPLRGKLNVLEALSGESEIEPSNGWDNYLTQVTDLVTQAQNAATSAQLSANQVSDQLATLEQDIDSKIETQVSTEVDKKLGNYYTKEEDDTTTATLRDEISAVDTKVDDVSTRTTTLEDTVNNFDGLASFDAEFVNESDTLVFYNGEEVMKEVQLNMTPSQEYTEGIKASYASADEALKTDILAEVDKKIDAVDISDELSQLEQTIADTYYNKEQTDELLTDKADNTTVTGLTTRVGAIEAKVNTLETNSDAVTQKLTEIEEKINNANTDPTVRYRTSYDGTTGTFNLIEVTENEAGEEVETIVSTHIIVGGSGGSSSSTSITIDRISPSPLVVVSGDKAIIKYKYTSVDSSGDDTGEGTATWKVGSTTVATSMALQGDNEFDITPYVTTGTQKVTLTIVDTSGSLLTKYWTVQIVDVRLESTFNDKYTYPLGEIAFSYIPYGSIEKTIHFILDGEELDSVVTTASGVPMNYTLPAQEHGSHLLETHITAEVNGSTIETDHIFKDILWYDETSTAPVIGCTTQNIVAKQYDNTNIIYTVYDPATETPRVTLAIDGEVVSTQTMTSSTQTWQYKSSDIGTHVLTITCKDTVKTINVTIEKLDINVTPVTANLAFDFNPSGYSNNDDNRLWTNGTVSMTVSDNFDWVNGGYQLDENGDQYFCVKAGTNAVIDYQLFADDAKKNGKEFKLVFKTTNVQVADAKILSCIDNTTETNHVGIEMFVHEAFIYSGTVANLNLPYSEDDIIEFEFNISTNQEDIPMIMGYEDGVSTRPLVYDDTSNFTQNTPKYISIGSDYCDIHIYRFKVYNTSLTAQNILSNFIADARNAEEMISRYNLNQIYDENKNLTPESLAAACPWLRIYKLSAPYFTNNKSDKVPRTTIQQIYKNGDPILDNWICYDCSHSGQGTSSNNYGAAGRNLDFIMNKSQIEGVNPYFILGDGTTRVTEITQTRTSVPVAYLNFKANIASSNNLTNAMLANRYNKFNPYKRPFVRDEDVDTSFIKDTMEFYNAVVFIQETNTDISTHREFADCDYHFYALGNIGDSKKSDKTRLTDMDDPYECCIEIMDVELPLSDFPQDTMMNAMGYKVDETTNEKIYTWAKDENLGILYELIGGEYVLTEDTTINLDKIYYVDILEHDDFSEDYTYGWRYISDDEDEEIIQNCKDAWINFYRFITNSTDEEFKTQLSEYAVLNSLLYYYLFTTRYTMVDNRAKNTFLHFGKTGTYRAITNPNPKLLHLYCELIDGEYIATADAELDETKTYYCQHAFDLSWDYDNDTACGLNNYGAMVYRYGLEDTDVDEKGEEVFREMDSTFFCRIRDLFPEELKALYNTLESQNAWHAESFLNDCDVWQEQFPEELWRLDIERKYIRTYTSSFIDDAGDSQFLVNMANGRMRYHRRQWERNQEKYMASKYQSSVAASDNMVLRCTVPTGDLVIPVNYRLKITPYAYMYLNIKYGTTSPIQMRVEPGIEYEIPFEGESADIIDIYSASFIQSLGDLSSCYAGTVDTSKGVRLKEIIIGNTTEGYDNPYLTTLTLGANALLEVLNIENVSGLTQSLNLSLLKNLKELYAHGTNVGGVTFANGGLIEIAELPAINAMTMKNLAYLTTLDIVSFDKLTTLIIENCSTVDAKSIFEKASNLNRVRITGINWSLEDYSLLERIYKMSGIDTNGYNVTQSVLSGNVYVPLMKEKLLADFNEAWPDLVISYDTLVTQFSVTFQNDDGTILDVQYVDKGSFAVDPLTREEEPIATPTKESTVSTDYTFAGWDSDLIAVFGNQVITATYSESLRKYTIQYVSKGTVLQTTEAEYGSMVLYEGDTPTYTAEEAGYKYYLFTEWDKSGFVDGDKIIEALYDSCEYSAGYFDDLELSEMRPVEIYAMTVLEQSKTVIPSDHLTDGDDLTFSLGHDYNYSDVESVEFISEKTVFTGTNHIDTGVKLFEEDRDFVLAVDYKISNESPNNSVLIECFQPNGTNGFKLHNGSGIRLTWGSTDSKGTISTANEREMLIIRHIKGDNNLHIYTSNLGGNDIRTEDITRTKTTEGTASLVLGCSVPEEGYYENHAVGEIHWCKLWYADLGDEACRQLASWTHESVTLEVAGFKRFYLSDNPSKRCSFSLLATHLLSRSKTLNSANSTSGGWASMTLNSYLNERLYNAIPIKWKPLFKQVQVTSSIGNKSTETSISDCYITIPSVYEVDAGYNTSPYNSEGSSISFMTTNDSRKRAYPDGDYANYWLRSPNIQFESYNFSVDENGAIYGYGNPAYDTYGVLIELSI